MFIKKKWSVTDDGHTMGMESADALETMAEEAIDENIEKDHGISNKLLDSGKTKKKMSTRRSSDNTKKKVKEYLRMRYERETLFDAESHEYGKFRHNGTVKVLSEEEKKEFIIKRNIERLTEMRS